MQGGLLAFFAAWVDCGRHAHYWPHYLVCALIVLAALLTLSGPVLAQASGPMTELQGDTLISYMYADSQAQVTANSFLLVQVHIMEAAVVLLILFAVVLAVQGRPRTTGDNV